MRGAEEHFYRACSRAYFTDAEWAELSEDERSEISKTMFRVFIAQAEGALLSGTFDSRLDRWSAPMPFRVDERGWEELTATIVACRAEVEQIRHGAGKRLEDESETQGIPLSFGIFSFKSPIMGEGSTHECGGGRARSAR